MRLPVCQMAALTASVFLAMAQPLAAQGTAVSLGVSNHNIEQPVEITSEELSLDQASGVATSSMRTWAQIPSGSRKVSRPDSLEMPAPVRTTMRRWSVCGMVCGMIDEPRAVP